MSNVLMFGLPEGADRAWQKAKIISPEAGIEPILKVSRDSLLVVPSASVLALLIRFVEAVRARPGRPLLVLDSLSTKRLALLRTMFRRVVSRDEVRLLPDDILAKVLTSEDRDDRFIGVTVDTEDEVVILYRGNLDAVVEPFSAFPARPHYPKPDFSDVEITDYGQTVRLGDYEAATSAILYETDAAYRKRYKANLIECDDSFGGSLKRLRLQKELKRSDFSPLDPKTIERIEQNKEKPRPETLKIIAARLGVSPEDIETF